MATRVIDDTKLQSIATAIQAKDNGGQMTVDEMPTRIANIPTGTPVVLNPAFVLWDWEGTKLAEYSAEDALALIELPAPSTLPAYATADHELLLFQEWNWSLANIKTWIQNHEGETLNVGAIYTTTDGEDHNYWGAPRLDTETTISMQKRGTTDIAASAFQDYKSLKRINIPNGSEIKYQAFRGCRAITHINMPNGITVLENGAFNGDTSLVRVTIPNGVLSITPDVFNSCVSLNGVDIPDSVTTIGQNAFQYCYAIREISIPDSVTTIGQSAFQHCRLLQGIDIPDSVTTIGQSAFDGCYSLARAHLPNNMERITLYMFRDCYALTQLEIPSGVTDIEGSAFVNCSSLCDVVVKSTAPYLYNVNAFSGLPSTYRIYVPRAALDWFLAASSWSSIKTRIVAIEDYIEYLESIGIDVDEYK